MRRCMCEGVRGCRRGGGSKRAWHLLRGDGGGGRGVAGEEGGDEGGRLDRTGGGLVGGA